MKIKATAKYMTCNSYGFEPGDDVVVKFENCSYEQPAVVGFWDSPKICPFLFEIWIGDYKAKVGDVNFKIVGKTLGECSLTKRESELNPEWPILVEIDKYDEDGYWLTFSGDDIETVQLGEFNLVWEANDFDKDGGLKPIGFYKIVLPPARSNLVFLKFKVHKKVYGNSQTYELDDAANASWYQDHFIFFAWDIDRQIPVPSYEIDGVENPSYHYAGAYINSYTRPLKEYEFPLSQNPLYDKILQISSYTAFSLGDKYWRDDFDYTKNLPEYIYDWANTDEVAFKLFSYWSPNSPTNPYDLPVYPNLKRPVFDGVLLSDNPVLPYEQQDTTHYNDPNHPVHSGEYYINYSSYLHGLIYADIDVRWCFACNRSGPLECDSGEIELEEIINTPLGTKTNTYFIASHKSLTWNNSSFNNERNTECYKYEHYIPLNGSHNSEPIDRWVIMTQKLNETWNGTTRLYNEDGWKKRQTRDFKALYKFYVPTIGWESKNREFYYDIIYKDADGAPGDSPGGFNWKQFEVIKNIETGLSGQNNEWFDGIWDRDRVMSWITFNGSRDLFSVYLSSKVFSDTAFNKSPENMEVHKISDQINDLILFALNQVDNDDIYLDNYQLRKTYKKLNLNVGE